MKYLKFEIRIGGLLFLIPLFLAIIYFIFINDVCENHIDKKIKPVFVKGVIVKIDTLHSTNLVFHYDKNCVGENMVFYDAKYIDSLGNVSIGDSILKEVGIDIFTFKFKKNGKTLKVKYPCYKYK
jgi:hypothetical protein